MIVLPGEMRTCKRGTLINVSHGYNLHWLRNESWGWGFWPFKWTKAIHSFKLHPQHPIVWVNTKGHWQPDRHEEETDLGSTPPPIRSCFPQDQYEPGYIFHDSAYKHGGLYHSVFLDGPYKFKSLTRSEADDLLADIIMALGGGAGSRGTIWTGVRMGGWASYKEARTP